MDWNNDGLIDILAGDEPGNVTIFLNTTSNSNPVMDNGALVQAGGSKLAGGRAVPEVVDWDEDGRKDLLVGTVNGTVGIYINEGSDSAPVYNTKSLLQSGGADFDIGTRSAPRVMDWNNDGLKDLIVGALTGNIYVLENTGTNAAPVFNTVNQLLLQDSSPMFYDNYSRFFITDWDNDGLNDILVGGESGKVMIFMGTP